MDEYYVQAFNFDNPDVVEDFHASSLEDAYEILDMIWARGPAWDGYISKANDLSTSETETA